MSRPKVPKILKNEKGEEFIFKKIEIPKKFFSYYKKDDPKKEMILSPKYIELNFKREDVRTVFETQEEWGCVIASLSMYLRIPQEVVRTVFLNKGWVKEKGASLSLIKKSLKDLGFLGMYHETPPRGSCLVFAESLNSPGYSHCLFFDGETLYDPQTNNKGFLSYGSDWGIEEIGWGYLTISTLQAKLLLPDLRITQEA